MPVLAFLLATFALTWAAWLATALPNPGSSVLAVGGPIFLLGVFAPAIVALLLTALGEGRAGVSALLGRIGQWQVPLRYYAFALGYMAVLKLSAAVIHRGATGGWPAFGDTPVAVMAGAIVVSTWTQAGEELGWRGYALPRLAGLFGLRAAGIVLGVVWAVWHLPLFFMSGTGSTDQPFLLYLLHVTSLSVAMTWLFWRTAGSLLVVMVMHAAVNNTIGIVPSAEPVGPGVFALGGSFVGWVTVGLSWLVAACLLFQMRRANLPHPFPKESSE